MNAILSLGRWLFPLPFAIFGIMHLMTGAGMAGMVPDYMPAKTILVYLSGAGLLGAAISMYIGKYDKLATTLLGIMLILFAVMIHMPGAMAGGEESAGPMGNLLKDLGLAGAALMYAQNMARDNSVIG
ncbi:MAG: DoxX family protein [Bacteroidetes bacterium]|nr:MAG: DoxX family protein [Bacteroidota bacterium]